MKPDDLHPTAAALFDDDGRSAYQPSRRRQYPSTQTRAARRLPRGNPRRNAARWAAWHATRTPEQERDRWRAAARARRVSHLCPDCGAPCSGQGSGRCIPCGTSFAARRETNASLQRDLREPFRGGRSRHHEARVAALAADQLRLPL